MSPSVRQFDVILILFYFFNFCSIYLKTTAILMLTPRHQTPIIILLSRHLHSSVLSPGSPRSFIHLSLHHPAPHESSTLSTRRTRRIFKTTCGVSSKFTSISANQGMHGANLGVATRTVLRKLVETLRLGFIKASLIRTLIKGARVSCSQHLRLPTVVWHRPL